MGRYYVHRSLLPRILDDCTLLGYCNPQPLMEEGVSLQATVQTVDTPQGDAPDRYGRYEILKKIATGGMGEVYLARSVGAAGFQKHVVIKRILPHLVEQSHFVDALVREAKLLVMLDHPNIIQVFDLGVEGRDYFMAMEYVAGYNMATVAHYCAHERVLIPTLACAAIGIGTLEALSYAHEIKEPDGQRHNIIHRDVSPQNVMISKDGRVKLTDFGIAKVLRQAEGEVTRTLKGKFRYMAPEALDGGRIDQRYDLFAVGILLYESLCRRHLFGGRSDVEILRQVRAARVPDIRRYHPDVPPRLVEVANKALSKDPEARYRTAREFLAALREAVSPASDTEAASELRRFIFDIYNRPDFPINKPKMPNLADARLEPTRAIVLRSHVTVDGSAAAAPALRSRGASRLAIGLIGIAVVVLAGAVAYLAYRMQAAKERQGAKDPVFIVTRDKATPPPPTPGPPPPDPSTVTAAADQPPKTPKPIRPTRRKRNPKAIRFTREVGKRYFGRHGKQISRCFDKHTRPDDPLIRLGVVSEVRGDGRVASVRIQPEAQAKTSLGRCVTRVARRIRYPRHDQPSITFLQPLTVRRTSSL